MGTEKDCGHAGYWEGCGDCHAVWLGQRGVPVNEAERALYRRSAEAGIARLDPVESELSMRILRLLNTLEGNGGSGHGD